MCENKEPMVSYTIQGEVVQVPAYIEYLLSHPWVSFKDPGCYHSLHAINNAIVQQHVSPEEFRKLIKDFTE